jgi:multidrug efflux pump subunit AcrA (membrane-fusion protein)
MLLSNRGLRMAAFLAFIAVSCGRSKPMEPGAGEQVIAIRVQKPDQIQHPVTVAASGTVEAGQTVDFGFQVAGRVSRVLVEEGQSVRKGELIAKLDDADYQYGLHAYEEVHAAALSADADLAAAEYQVAAAVADLERLAGLQ